VAVSLPVPDAAIGAVGAMSSAPATMPQSDAAPTQAPLADPVDGRRDFRMDSDRLALPYSATAAPGARWRLQVIGCSISPAISSIMPSLVSRSSRAEPPAKRSGGHGCRTSIVTPDLRAVGNDGLNGNRRPEWMNAGKHILCIVGTP
jgi:hypothetical protein